MRGAAPWRLSRASQGANSIAALNALICRTGVRVWQWDVQTNALQFSDDLIGMFGLDPEEA